MTTEKGTVIKFDWGDGTIIKVRIPDLSYIPGDSVVCPTPCNPIGETAEEWEKNEAKTRIQPQRDNQNQ